MEILLTKYHWLQLTNEQRAMMRAHFNIPRSSGVEMQGNVMKSDGSNENDLKAVNVLSMREFMGGHETNDTFETLYNATIKKIDGMILKEKLDTEQSIKDKQAHRRTLEMGEVVESVLTTIDNLPLDAKVKIYTYLQDQVGHKHLNVQESNSTEEVKEAGDQPTAEGTRKRGRPAKRVS